MGVVIFGNYGHDKTMEVETVSCPHCQQQKGICHKGLAKKMPYAAYCNKCRKPICKECAKFMQELGQCPGPFIAKVEESIKRGEWNDNFVYHYSSTTGARK